MGIELPIVVYTHTDMKDIWPMFFGQFQKYISGVKVYVAVNKKDDTIPSEYIQLHYDDSKKYTERWKEILPQIDEDIIMFLHEDMILFDSVKYEYIERYYNYIKNNDANSIKLILAGETFNKSSFDETLITNEYSKFSIQPTIVTKEVFLSTLNSVGELNIWEFEQAVIATGRDYMVGIGGEKKRGLYHYDSLVFPYIATAINKGKWNYSEYQKELDELFTHYNINPFERGIV
jgi:hypothetical protein